MMGMFVVHGAQAGGFSPISIYGIITNSVMRENDLPNSEITIFLSSLVINTILAAILFFVLGGRELMSRRIDPEEDRARRAAGTGGGTDRGGRDRRTAGPGPDPDRVRRRRAGRR